MDWLSVSASVITGIATVVLAVITFYYVRLTGRILEENQLMRLDAHKPEIAVSLYLQKNQDTNRRVVVFRIENIGTGPARDVKFTTDCSVELGGGTPLKRIGALKNGITYFGHGRTMEYIITDKNRLNERETQTPIEIAVTYKDSAKHKYENTFRLDFGELEGLWQSALD